MKTNRYMLIVAFLAALICGCPKNRTVDSGTDIGSDVPSSAVDASVDQ